MARAYSWRQQKLSAIAGFLVNFQITELIINKVIFFAGKAVSKQLRSVLFIRNSWGAVRGHRDQTQFRHRSDQTSPPGRDSAHRSQAQFFRILEITEFQTTYSENWIKRPLDEICTDLRPCVTLNCPWGRYPKLGKSWRRF